MYATVDDLRGEGVTEEQASDERLTQLLEEATSTIDRATQQFFEPRELTLQLDGRGVPTLDLPANPIRIDSITLDETVVSLAAADLVVLGQTPSYPPIVAPRVTRVGGVFTKGVGNVMVAGLWGYTEIDGTETGRTPLAIRRACMLIVLRTLPPLGDAEARDESERGHLVTSEKTRDQSYTREPDRRSAPFTGDPEIDQLLLDFWRPFRLGAA